MRTEDGADEGVVTITVRRDIAAQLLALVEDCAAAEGYGHFPGGDPRDFTPDPECSTEEERAAHERDCAAMNAGGQALMPPTGEWRALDKGGAVHFHRAAYGLGAYVLRDPSWEPVRDALRAALGDPEGA